MNNLFLGRSLAILTRNYISAVSKLLEEIDIDRYFIVLILIKTSDRDLTQQEISEALQLDKVMMVKMIDYLSHHKYVERIRNPEDRREQIIRLTPKAKKVIPRIIQAYTKVNENIFYGMTKKEIETFYTYLNIIHTNLEKENKIKMAISIKRKSQKRN